MHFHAANVQQVCENLLLQSFSNSSFQIFTRSRELKSALGDLIRLPSPRALRLTRPHKRRQLNWRRSCVQWLAHIRAACKGSGFGGPFKFRISTPRFRNQISGAPKNTSPKRPTPLAIFSTPEDSLRTHLHATEQVHIHKCCTMSERCT